MPNYKISSYTTSRNILDMAYPFKESISSMASVCDEVIVFDTSNPKTDNTLEVLNDLSKKHSTIKVIHEDWDWNVPNSGVLDGKAKAEARKHCTHPILCQIDLDEILHEKYSKEYFNEFCNKYVPMNASLALPVIEYWGPNKIRLDINLLKPRITMNSSCITHGIPNYLENIKSGLLYAKHGTDGCDYIETSHHMPIPSITHVLCLDNRFEQYKKQISHNGNQSGIAVVKRELENIWEQVPTFHHYSWFSIERKINQYKKFWTRFWPSLYGESLTDNVMFPGRSWEDISDQEIKDLAKDLETKTAGHIFHQPWDGKTTFGLSTIDSKITHPSCMLKF